MYFCEWVWALLPGETTQMGTWERLEHLVLMQYRILGTARGRPSQCATNRISVALTPKGSCSTAGHCTASPAGKASPPTSPRAGERGGMHPVTHNHVLQGVFGKPAVQKHGNKQIPQRRPEYLQKQELTTEKSMLFTKITPVNSQFEPCWEGSISKLSAGLSRGCH